MFGTQSDRPAYLREARIEIPPYLEQRLESLSAELLAEKLSDVLGERQRAAVLARRDQLIAD
jgi:hypothetical protein